MTGAEVLNLLMFRLGNRTEADLRAACLLEMKMAQQVKLEQGPIKPWFIISEETEAVMTPNERRLEVPDDFIMELEEESSLYIVDENGKQHELVKKTWDENVGWHGLDSTADLPENYSLVGMYFMIFPIPLQARTVRLRYYARQAVVADDNTETTWTRHAPDLILAEAGLSVAQKHIQIDADKITGFQGDVAAAWDRINRENVARAEANMSRRMG